MQQQEHHDAAGDHRHAGPAVLAPGEAEHDQTHDRNEDFLKIHGAHCRCAMARADEG
jgi:hypothetical protein